MWCTPSLDSEGETMVHRSKNFGPRPRKVGADQPPKGRRNDHEMTENIWFSQHSDLPPSYSRHVRSAMKKDASKWDRLRCGGVCACDTHVSRMECREYLQTSTLHGLRYIGEAKLTWFERIFWLIAVGVSLLCAILFIVNVYDKWSTKPMIVSVNPEKMALRELPFPAITICNVNQAKKSVATRYRQSGSIVDKKLLQSLCSSDNDTAIFGNTTAEDADWDYFRSFLINVTQPCSEMLVHCKWNSQPQDCLQLFNAQLTDEGLCCTFNVVHRDMMFKDPKNLYDLNMTFPLPAVDWTPEGGYPPDAPFEGFPWRPLGTGTHHGLTLVLDVNAAEYYCASTICIGFKILLHNPTETPKIANLGELYAPGAEVRVAVTPRVEDCSRDIIGIDVNKRLCVFSSETNLSFFRTYTQQNCEMECEAETMLKKCNCVLYYMPKNRSTRVCGKSDANCYSSRSSGRQQLRPRVCSCLPGCTELAYSVRRSSAPLTGALLRHLHTEAHSPEYYLENMLIIHFFFESHSFVRYTKGVIFGFTEFLSNTGGLLSLCMGFSVMSLVELVYFMTIRTTCGARRRRSQRSFIH